MQQPTKIEDLPVHTSQLLILVWLGQWMPFAVYFFIAYSASSNGEAAAEPLLRTLTIVFAAAAMICVVVGAAFHRFIFSPARLQTFISELKLLPDESCQNAALDARALDALAMRVFSLYTAGLGMVHSAAVFGMVLAILHRNVSVYLPFLAASAVGALFVFPRLNTAVKRCAETWTVRPIH